MTDRERWTIYPLLFLTLGIAVKDRLTDTVQCGTLGVRDRQGNQQVIVTSTPSGGLVRAQGTKDKIDVLMGHVENYAGLMFVDASGKLHGPRIIQPSVPAKVGPPAEAPPDAAEGRPAVPPAKN